MNMTWHHIHVNLQRWGGVRLTGTASRNVGAGARVQWDRSGGGSVTEPCLTLEPQRLQPARLLCPQDFPGKNMGVGCHFLLQETFLTWNKSVSSCLAGGFFITDHLGSQEN